MVETMKKLGNMIATAVNLDNDVEDSAATVTYNADDSKPLPEIPPPNQSQSKEQSSSDQENEEKRVLGETKQVTCISETMKDGQRLEITIERQVQTPASLADQVNVVFPSLADDIKDVLAVDSAQTVPDVESLNEDHQQHGFHHSKASNPELYTDIPKEVTPEMKSLQQEVTGQVREIGGGSYLHPKKIVEIPPELSQQMRTLHEDLNKEVARGAELLHPKEIVEIPKELSQDIRGLRGALNRELKNGVDVLHPKEIVQIPTELSLEIRRLHKELNSEFKSAANVLQPKEIAEIPSELGQEAQDLHGDLNEEVKQFGNFHHLHPKQIAEIPTELSREVEKMHKALNEEVIQADGTRLLHPKQIAEIPEEVTAKDRELHSELAKEVAYVGGKEILHPKVIAEVPEGLCQEVRYLHEDLNYEVKQIGPNHLHPKQIAEIPAEASPKVRKAQIYLMEEVKTGAQMLHPKEIVEIPGDLNQETRDLHKDLNVEVQLFGGASRLQDGEQSLEPPKELAESVKEVLPSLTTEIKEFNGPHKLHYNCIPNQHKEHNGVAPKLDIDSFQTHVEQMLLLYGAADSGLDLSASNKQASGNPVLDECVESVVSALIQAAKKLRGPLTDTDVLVEELHRRRSIIDVEDSAPAKEQPKQVSQDDNGKPLDVEPANDENWTVLEQHDSGQSDQNAKEPVPIPRSETNDDKELKKSKLMRRLSGWKASYATLNDEGGASDPVYAHAKGKEVAKDTDNKNENRQTSPMRKLRWNPFRKHHRQHVDAV